MHVDGKCTGVQGPGRIVVVTGLSTVFHFRMNMCISGGGWTVHCLSMSPQLQEATKPQYTQNSRSRSREVLDGV